MNVRIASVNEITFLKCFKHKVWGANKISQNDWELGDKLVFKIGNKLVGLATVSGELYLDSTVIWDNGLFWSRIPLKFDYMLGLEKAIIFNEKLRGLFLEKWGTQYGWVILNKKELPEDIAEEILDVFDGSVNSLDYYEQNIDSIINNYK